MKRLLAVMFALFVVSSLWGQTSYIYRFQVDMSVAVAQGYFNPDEDVIQWKGGLDGWAGTDMTLAGGNVYFVDFEIADTLAGTSTEYKYFIVSAGNSNPPNGGWETIGNRAITFEAKDSILDVVYFDNRGPDQILTQDTPVKITVDMRTAYYKLMAGDTIEPGSGASFPDGILSVDSVYLAGGEVNVEPQMAWVHDFINQPEVYEPLEMFDDGATRGDEVANDSIFTIDVLFKVGAATNGICKFDLNLNDCEAGFAMNHEYTISTETTRLDFIFGSQDPERWAPYLDMLSVEDDAQHVAESFTLEQNYPNPFNPTTTIRYTLDRPAEVQLVVFNALGQKVKTLVNGFVANSVNTVEWNGTNDAGQAVSSGIYFYTLKVGNQAKTMKMVMMK
ncbi:MAG: hypothetical protein Kow00108_11590 [Calditrichia bacterium]